MNAIRHYTLMAALILCAIVLGETPPLKTLDQFLRQQDPWPLAVTGGLTVAGLFIMMGGIVKMLMDQDESISHEDVEDVERSVRMAAIPVTWRASSYRVWGRTAGKQGADQFRLHELKQAWRTGAIWHEPLWRRRGTIAVGALMMIGGLLGVFVVVGPPWVKALMGGALIYIFVRLGRGLWTE